MIAQMRAEFLRQRSVRTGMGLLFAMVGIVIVVILLHALELPAQGVSKAAGQLLVMGQGQRMGTLFGALLGALAITTDYRFGTIRPILLGAPRREVVVAAKVVVSMLIGALFGLTAAALSAAIGSAALLERGITLQLAGGDYAQLIAGSAVGAMLWAAIGVGVGAIARSQVPVMVGLCTWLLFIEGLLFGDIGLSNYGRLFPGALAASAAGLNQTVLLTPAPAVALLGAYALAATVIGWAATTRRDVA